MSDLPVLDYAKYAQGIVTERLEFANDLVESFKKYGFVKIVNHGISDEQVQQIFEWSDRFFSLSLKVKQKLEMAPTPDPQRGYLSYGVEKTSQLTDIHEDVEHLAQGKIDEELVDERESFTIGPPEDGHYPNIWPDKLDLPGFREFTEKHFRICRAISLHLVEATAMGLKIPATALLDRCVPDRSEQRFNFYPESSVETLNSGTSQRIWPHTDFGVLTLLFQDGVGGLELEDRPNGRKFVPVTTSSQGACSELVVNTGDCLQRWTNNVIRAGLHQVSIPNDLKSSSNGVVPKRISCPFFLEANYDKSVGPLPQFVSDQHPAEYEEISSIEYHKQRVEKEYSGASQSNGDHRVQNRNT